MNLLEKTSHFFEKYFLLLLGSAITIGVLLRFSLLGSASLTDLEASNALQALDVIRAKTQVTIEAQPGYVGLTSFLFFFFGSSEYFARFWPALFGVVLIFSPHFFRKQLDIVTSTMLSLIIAFEPGLVALSRTADGTMIMITSVVLMLGFLANRKVVPAGIFLGLAVISSEKVWMMALSITLTWLIMIFIAKKTQDDSLKEKMRLHNCEPNSLWKFSLSAILVIVMVSTQFFYLPKGISGLGTSIITFLQSWKNFGGYSLGSFSLILLSTQFLVFVFGIWGMVEGLQRKSMGITSLGIWWAVGLLLIMINPSRDIWHIVLVNLPGYLLTGFQLKNFLAKIVIQSKTVALIEIAATISLSLFSTMNFLNMVNFPPVDADAMRNRLIGVLLPLALWIVFTMLLAWGWDIPSAKSGLIIGLGLMLGAILVGSGWKAASLGSLPENELISNRGVIRGEDHLIQVITDVSRWTNGQATRIDIDVVGLDSPSLTWALRNFEQVTSNSVFPLLDQPSIVISSMAYMLDPQPQYRGQEIIWRSYPNYSQMIWRDWVKWQFLRDIPLVNENILLWIRNDLFVDITSQLP